MTAIDNTHHENSEVSNIDTTQCEQINILNEIDAVKPLNTTKYTYKAHSLIEMSYELPITEQRILGLACKKLKPLYIENNITPEEMTKLKAVMTFTNMKISVSEYKKEYNINTNTVYAAIAKSIDKLFDRYIYFYKDGKLRKMRWIATADYDEGEGCFYITLNPDLIEQLLLLKGKYVALMYDLSQESKSRYSYRLYEILKSNSYNKVYTVSIEDLKFMLCISPDQYKEFKLLNSKILKPNIANINKNSDIYVEYKGRKIGGRSTTHIEFNIIQKNIKVGSRTTALKDSMPNAYNKIIDTLTKYNITLSDAEITKLIDNAVIAIFAHKVNIPVADYVVEKIEYMQSVLVSEDIRNVVGFLLHCIDTNKKDNIKISKKNGFHNFTERDYTKEYVDNLELQLLGWDKD